MKTDYELSIYQNDILNYIKYDTGNLLVDAKAGSGKTSTLLLIADLITKQNKNCLFLAFNKSIVNELSEKINNTNCMVKTIHSLGLSFIKSHLYRLHRSDYELIIDTTRLRENVKYYYEKICAETVNKNNFDLPPDDLKELHTHFISDLVNLCNFCRLYNVNYSKKGATDWLLNKCCWYINRQREDVPKYQQVIINVIDDIKYKFEHPETLSGKPVYVIDYTDMIYFPVYYNMSVPYSLKGYLDYVLVDESQDLSILQQYFVRQLDTGSNRFIFVGDKYQAIYGFAGADTHSIDNIKKNFILKELPLNICYRCPENVIKLAKDIVPTIEWNKAREDKGTVKLIKYENLKDCINAKDVLIGRKNKDLVSIYREFAITNKIPVKFRNQDLVNRIIKEIESAVKEYIRRYNRGLNIDKKVVEHLKEFRLANDIDVPEDSLLYRNEKENYVKQCILDNLQGKQISKSNQNIDYLLKCMDEYKEEGAFNYPSEMESEDDRYLNDYFDIIQSFIEDYKQKNMSILVKNFLTYLNTFLSSSLNDNVPIISTIHSMKGGEADNVFIYDYPNFPYEFKGMSDEEKQQEKNLLYVAITRTKKNLYLLGLKEDCEEAVKTNLECEAQIEMLLKGKSYIQKQDENKDDVLEYEKYITTVILNSDKLQEE